jgi:hypothetical protein
MKTVDGAHLPWGCLRSLSTVDESKLEIALTFIEKHGFFEGAIEEALDISPVGEYRSGPRLTQPKSLDAGLRQVRSWSTGWLKRYRASWAEGSEWIRSAGSPESLAELGQTREYLRNLAESALDLEKRLALLESRMRKRQTTAKRK